MPGRTNTPGATCRAPRDERPVYQNTASSHQPRPSETGRSDTYTTQGRRMLWKCGGDIAYPSIDWSKAWYKFMVGRCPWVPGLQGLACHSEKWGGQSICCPPLYKKWGGHVPPVPHLSTPLSPPPIGVWGGGGAAAPPNSGKQWGKFGHTVGEIRAKQEEKIGQRKLQINPFGMWMMTSHRQCPRGGVLVNVQE